MIQNFTVLRLRQPGGLKALFAILFLQLVAGGFLQANTYDVPDGDVPALVAAMETAQDGEVIQLAQNGTYTLTAVHNTESGPNGLPVITRAITIEGNGATIERAGSAPSFRIFHLRDTDSGTRLFNLTIKGGRSLTNGGGLLNWNSSPTIIACEFQSNRAEEIGGGMANLAGSNPAVEDTAFIDNRSWWGGGMANRGSSPWVSGALFQGNLAQDNDFDDGGGGGMANFDQSHPIITDSVFQGNDADFGWGGGIYNENSNPVITASVFELNWADPLGGAIYNTGSSPEITNTLFERNWAANHGGAVANVADSDPSFADVVFLRNGVNDHGGGMYNNHSSPTVIRCEFIENVGDDSGGMANLNNSNPTVRDSLFENNRFAEWGGGMHNRASSPTVENTVFRGNRAWEGGGMFNRNSHPVIIGCTFEDNFAEDDGGAIFNSGSNPEIVNTSFTGNTADYAGGGMMNVGSSQPTVTESVFDGNVADDGGGIFSATGSSVEVESTFFCRNEPDDIVGAWNDRGSNEFCESAAATSYDSWVRKHFPAEEWEDKSRTGPEAKPAGDRLANLLRYALGLAPNESAPAALPQPTLQGVPEEGGENFLVLVFSHPADRSDIEYRVEVSSDLSDWTEQAVLVSSAEEEGVVTRTYRDTNPSNTVGTRFMRLVVERD